MNRHSTVQSAHRKRRAVPTTTTVACVLGLGLVAAPTIGLSADVTVGAGMRASFSDTNYSGPTKDVSDFSLDNARLYISGKVTDQIGFMFNTQYSTGGASGSNVTVMDAAAQFSFSPSFNIWAGRFLPPSDRSNLYGPYYASNWGVYQDGVQDGYPSGAVGRDDGILYWGQFGKLKLSAGAFDVPQTSGNKDVLYAARAQVDLWDAEDGYYLNGTYYGAKDLLAFGVAGQVVGSDQAYSADVLLEKKLAGAGVVTLEAEYANYDGLGGYAGTKSDGYYGLVGYLFPTPVGIGKFQALVKYGTATYTYSPTLKEDHDTLELNLNYLIKDFNARISLFYIDHSYNKASTDSSQIGIGLQIQM